MANRGNNHDGKPDTAAGRKPVARRSAAEAAVLSPVPAKPVPAKSVSAPAKQVKPAAAVVPAILNPQHSEPATKPAVFVAPEPVAPIAAPEGAAPSKPAHGAAPVLAEQDVQPTVKPTIKPGADIMNETIQNNADRTANAANQAANQAAAAANHGADQFRAVVGNANEQTKAAMEKNARLVEEMTDLSRGNMEALVASQKTAAKYAETLSQGAAEYSRRSFEQASAALKSFAEVKSPTDFFRLQSDYARSAFDQMVAENARVSETVMKMTGEVAEPITNRYSVAAERMKAVAA